MVAKNHDAQLIKIFFQYAKNITSSEKKELFKSLLQNNHGDKDSLTSIIYKKLFSLDYSYEVEGDNITFKHSSNSKELNIEYDTINQTVDMFWGNQSIFGNLFETDLTGEAA